MPQDNKPRPARRRARNKTGHFKADDPTTTVNEAWEPVPTEEALPKKVGTNKVSGLSTDSAGKYSKKSKVNKPTFGNVTSISY